MESILTKKIKKSIRSYNPALGSSMRTVRWAEEVDTGLGGYVDSIRFEDYIQKDNSFCVRDCCKISGEKYPNKKCKGCFHVRHDYDLGILTTCYEVKITKSDFKSKNGHNFIGNCNYYVIPKDLYKEIKDLIPIDIGVILYYENGSLRKKKDCIFKDIEKDILIKLLYNSMKKWCDLNIFQLEKFLN